MLPPDEHFRQVQHVVVAQANAGQRIDNFLMSLLKTVPRSLVYRLLRTGQVRVNKGRIKPGFKLSVGDDVRVPPVTVSAETRTHLPTGLIKEFEQAVFAEDEHWIVANKPAGLAVHGGTGVKFGAVDLIQRIYDDTSISLVHRLDRETSGCLVFAKNRPAAVHFQAALRDGSVEKKYRAILKGELTESMVVDAPLQKNQPEAGDRMVVVDQQGKHALTRFYPVLTGRHCSLADIEIETGRTHQIRVHGAHSGHPVVGDTRYGDRRLNKTAAVARMYLHAASIAFPAPHSADAQPVPGRLSFAAAPAEDWSEALARLNGQ